MKLLGDGNEPFHILIDWHAAISLISLIGIRWRGDDQIHRSIRSRLQDFPAIAGNQFISPFSAHRAQSTDLMSNWPIAYLLATTFAASFALAGPSTRPHGQWHSLDYGELMLRDFHNAPYPHPSRSSGFKTFGPEHYQDSTVGIVIPKSFKPTQRVDLIVHFHGHRNYVENVLDQYRLPDQVLGSGCNAILIVPQGPKDAADSGFGRMEDEGGFQALVREVLEFLHDEKKISTTTIGRIALTAHSGGYKAVSAICSRGGLRDNITDVLLFDASYGDLDGFADWIKLGGERRLVSIFTAHLAPANFELLTLL